MTILAFWSVDSNDIGRDTLDGLSPAKAFKLLWENRREIQARFYDVNAFIGDDAHGLERYIGNADDLEEDYNDELLDGGHWMKAIAIRPETVFKIVRNEKEKD